MHEMSGGGTKCKLFLIYYGGKILIESPLSRLLPNFVGVLFYNEQTNEFYLCINHKFGEIPNGDAGRLLMKEGILKSPFDNNPDVVGDEKTNLINQGRKAVIIDLVSKLCGGKLPNYDSLNDLMDRFTEFCDYNMKNQHLGIGAGIVLKSYKSLLPFSNVQILSSVMVDRPDTGGNSQMQEHKMIVTQEDMCKYELLQGSQITTDNFLLTNYTIENAANKKQDDNVCNKQPELKEENRFVFVDYTLYKGDKEDELPDYPSKNTVWGRVHNIYRNDETFNASFRNVLMETQKGPKYEDNIVKLITSCKNKKTTV